MWGARLRPRAHLVKCRMTAPMPPRRLSPHDDMAPVLRLIQTAFAYMDGRIDPPSSMQRLTVAGIAEQARLGDVWVIGPQPVACMFLTPQPGQLYLGKLATHPDARGQGHARTLLALATRRAKALHLPVLSLKTRVELTENHAFFRALGFRETGRTAHPGFDRPTTLIFTKKITL